MKIGLHCWVHYFPTRLHTFVGLKKSEVDKFRLIAYNRWRTNWISRRSYRRRKFKFFADKWFPKYDFQDHYPTRRAVLCAIFFRIKTSQLLVLLLVAILSPQSVQLVRLDRNVPLFFYYFLTANTLLSNFLNIYKSEWGSSLARTLESTVKKQMFYQHGSMWEELSVERLVALVSSKI